VLTAFFPGFFLSFFPGPLGRGLFADWRSVLFLLQRVPSLTWLLPFYDVLPLNIYLGRCLLSAIRLCPRLSGGICRFFELPVIPLSRLAMFSVFTLWRRKPRFLDLPFFPLCAGDLCGAFFLVSPDPTAFNNRSRGFRMVTALSLLSFPFVLLFFFPLPPGFPSWLPTLWESVTAPP